MFYRGVYAFVQRAVPATGINSEPVVFFSLLVYFHTGVFGSGSKIYLTLVVYISYGIFYLSLCLPGAVSFAAGYGIYDRKRCFIIYGLREASKRSHFIIPLSELALFFRRFSEAPARTPVLEDKIYSFKSLFFKYRLSELAVRLLCLSMAHNVSRRMEG